MVIFPATCCCPSHQNDKRYGTCAVFCLRNGLSRQLTKVATGNSMGRETVGVGQYAWGMVNGKSVMTAMAALGACGIGSRPAACSVVPIGPSVYREHFGNVRVN